MKERRADHVHIAAVVLVRVFEALGLGAVTVSDWGLREGSLLDAHGVGGAVPAEQLRTAEVERIRRTFVADDPHAPHVAALARSLFDQTGELHGLHAGDRELLDHAARLHAIGEILALRRQHIHGAYMVENSELRGFSPTDMAILTTLVRFHPSKGINPSFPPYATLGTKDRSRTDRLLALLQAADGFDRAHDQAVVDLEVTHTDAMVEIGFVGGTLHTTADELARRLRRFEQTFSVSVRVGDLIGP